jgi:dihydrofolate synthase/folylpolyglutamate synthase
MRYNEFKEWMFSLERFGIKLGLENITEFLKRIGNPHHDLRSLHVTGTNGKGSICVLASEILRKHGLRVGLYTSPHLVDFRERIKINGREISEKDVVRLGTNLQQVMEAMAEENKEKQLTFFEFTTGLAFKYFAEKEVDMIVAEVGMGGRLDATNVLNPVVSAISRIGLEHTNYLGTTIQDIAREKAGIVKQGVSVVTCERKPEALAVITSACERKGALLRRIGRDFEVTAIRQSLDGTKFDYSGARNLRDLNTHLLGGYQAENAAGAIAIVEELAKRDLFITDEDIRRGLMVARWPGRLDVVSRNPLILFDGSHNPDGVSTTVGVLETLKATPLTFVLGCMDDKDSRGIVKALIPAAEKIVSTQAKCKRALPAKKLDRIVSEEFSGPRELFESSEDAFDHSAEDTRGRGLCVIGSLYLVGEAIPWWNKRGKTNLPASHKI